MRQNSSDYLASDSRKKIAKEMFRNLIHLSDTRLNAQSAKSLTPGSSRKKKGKQFRDWRLSVNQKNGRLVSVPDGVDAGGARKGKHCGWWNSWLEDTGDPLLWNAPWNVCGYALGVGVGFPAPLDSCAKKKRAEIPVLLQRCLLIQNLFNIEMMLRYKGCGLSFNSRFCLDLSGTITFVVSLYPSQF